MHADVTVVVKEGVVADLADPVPPAPPPKPEPPEPEVRALRFENRIFLACAVAGAVIGLLTRPEESAGARSRGNHFTLCLLGGIALGLILPLLRSFRKP
jgi:hypothetical protein